MYDLQVMCLSESTLCGLSACAALTSLSLTDSSWSVGQDMHIDLRELSLPSLITCLTSLQTLEVESSKGGSASGVLQCIARLTTLKFLTLSLQRIDAGNLAFVSNLTQLTRLCLRGAKPQASSLFLDISWLCLPALQNLSVLEFTIEVPKR